MNDTLTFTFNRRAHEHIDGAFAASYRMQSGNGGSRWLPSKSSFVIWLVIFVAIVVAMQLAERGVFHSNTVIGFFVGTIFGFGCMMAANIVYQQRLAGRMKAVVKEGGQITTELDVNGVRSVDEIAEIATTWDQAHMIWIEGDILYLMTDMFVHIIPKRALSKGQSLEQLHQAAIMMRDEYTRTRAQ